MISFFLVAGFLLLAACSYAVFLRRIRRERFEASRLVNWSLVITGLALAVGSVFITYSPSPTVRIMGFPFPAAAWEYSDGKWLDFVGITTLPFYAANFIIFLFLPQLCFVVFRTLNLRIATGR